MHSRATDNRHTYSIEQIKQMLIDQIDSVVAAYAPAVAGSYTLHGKYFTLNPGRVDKSVGSFWVDVSGGPKTGRWCDHATGQFGDVLDLIGLQGGLDASAKIREARAFLGLVHEGPEDRRRRQQAIQAGQARRAEGLRREAQKRHDAARRAHAVWLSAEESLRDTPVEFYLRDARGIDLRAMGRQPKSLRFGRRVFYKHIDPETGEVIEDHFPAMLALVHDGKGQVMALHRTYLALVDGRWNKAPVPKAKKVMGGFGGGSIRLSSGIGPRGGKGAPLAQCPAGSHVYITEGIEDGLSCAAILPEARVIAAISLGNFGQVQLPEAVSSVTLIADQDESPEARDAFERAVAAHAAAGRAVRVWRNRHGGKDLNDALRAARREGAA